jgi:hypothetical protein
MKTSEIAAALIGGLVGSAITFSAVKLIGGSPQQSGVEVPKSEDPTKAQSRFVAPKVDIDPDDYFHLLLTDPTDLTQRDMVIAMWYSNEDRTVKYLQKNTGHKFAPVSNQRSPVEVLEEQLVFWKEYLAESKRLKTIYREKTRAEVEAQQPAGPPGGPVRGQKSPTKAG